MKSTLCLLLIAFAGIVAAQESVAQYVNDNKVLNYALTLENFEAALYDYGRNTFSDSQYTAAGFPAGSKAAIDAIGVVERTHANQITALLGSRGYPAVAPCAQYNFTSITTPLQYVQALGVVESTGTSAYDGAASALTNKGVLQVAAGIATVEARHTALIEVILNATTGSFAPVNNDGSARTVTLAFSDVIKAVTPFFVFTSCPSTTLATEYNGTVTVNSNTPSSYQWQSANSLRAQGAAISTNFTIGTNDLAVLNYALALENLENTFYSTYANLYNVTNVMAAGFNFTAASLISANIAIIASHEASHVAFLSNQFKNAGTAGTVCTYTVGLNVNTSSFTDFLKVSVQLENTGVAAYVGAIGFLGNSDLATVAASIATVEGNHAAYVANVLSQLPTAPAVVNQLVGNTAGTPGTSGNIAAYTVDAGATPTAVQGSVVGQGKFIQCSSASLLGNPAPISINSPVDFFNDQAQVNPFPATTTTSNNNNNGPNTSTSSNSAAAVLVSIFVMLVAALF